MKINWSCGKSNYLKKSKCYFDLKIWPSYHARYFNSSLSVCSNRREKALVQPITRTSTGKLPLQRVADASTPTAAGTSKVQPAPAAPSTQVVNSKQIVVGHKATPEEIKEKIEQQLRIQRAAHHKRRALEMQKSNGMYFPFCFIKRYLFVR